MPTFSNTPAVMDLAAQIGATGLDVPSRTAVGSKDAAFGWTTGLPPIVARVVSQTSVEGSGYTAFIASPTGTPGSVAEGASKPTLAEYTTREIAVVKYAGLASVSTERALQTDAAVEALRHVLVQQVLKAYDEDCVAELVASSGTTGTGPTWSAAILDGLASVVGNGGSPDLLIMSGADYATAVESPGAGYALDPRDGVAMLFGLKVALAIGASAGEAFVLDSSAVVAGDGGTWAVVDPYSGLGVNSVRVAIEGFYTFQVTAPGAVAALTVA